MDINQLIEIVKRKINQEVVCENIKVEDKTFLHKKHKSQEKNICFLPYDHGIILSR